ncbi:MAG: peptidylprolyl isomerase [Xenococcus sp. (in: cyanobacteria)]
MLQTLIDVNKTITITKEDIFHQVQLSCKIPEIIEKIIERKIIISAAEEAGIEVTKEELQQASDQIRVMSQLKDAQATWAWLEKHGLSLDDFEEIVCVSLLSRKLTNHLFADQVEPYFYKHQLDYAAAIIYEIILDDEDEAIELYYEIQEGEISFFEAAQQYIQDTELRRQGGYRGKVNRTDMLPEISAAVFAAMSSQLLKPIVTSKGVHIIFVEDIIKSNLDEALHHQISSDMFIDFLDKQINNLIVENTING